MHNTNKKQINGVVQRQEFKFLTRIFKVLNITIKIEWCEIDSNFQLVPITTNYYQLLSIKIDYSFLQVYLYFKLYKVKDIN